MKRGLLCAVAICLAPSSWAQILVSPAAARPSVAGTFVFTASATEVDEDAGSVRVSVARINGSRGAVAVNVNTTSGTAVAGEDFTATDVIVKFKDGDTDLKSVEIPILMDRLPERNERFGVSLSNPSGGAVLGDPSVEAIGIIDKTVGPLTLLSSVPANGSSGVNRSSAIQLNFSAAIDPSTVPSNISLRSLSSGTVIATNATTSGSVVTLGPQTRLDPLAEYSAQIDVGLRAVNGEQLASATIVSFTTRDRAWLGAQLVETENLGDATASRLAFDSAGNAWVVWVQFNGTRNSVRAIRYVPGSGWQNPATQIENNVGDAFNPQVAIDATGNAMVVWLQKVSSTHYDTWANRYTVGSGWGTPTLIETGTGSSLGEPRIAMDATGNAIAVWPQSSSDPAHQDIWANRYIAGSGWGTATFLGPNAGTSFDPEIGMDASGNAIVVWRQPLVPAGLFSIWSNRYTSGSGWSGPTTIESSSYQALTPTVAVDGSGNALALWQQSNSTGTVYDIWFNRYIPGSGWGTEAGFGTSNYSLDAQISLNASGDGMAVWRQSTGGTVYNVWARRFSASASWDTAAQIDTSSTGTTTVPKIAVDSAGNAIAVWIRSDGTSNNVWANRYLADGGWGTPVLLETDVNHAFVPKIVFDSAGNALAVWTQYDGTRYNIWANRFE